MDKRNGSDYFLFWGDKGTKRITGGLSQTLDFQGEQTMERQDPIAIKHKAWHLLRGESPRRVKLSQLLVPSVAAV